ncbi:phenol 2-monooxygenase [Coccidioides immitis RMSCC 3703]|uniref:Phenol 2-monooxygenase n=1 Tax=Coccidioides immitis RMSCC 3703 TaxID=454286 RepID=A0A0J8U4K1_COCIT|nr:phenol 2-monooxygenase [Coccidioides immitis RMSCC 3703]
MSQEKYDIVIVGAGPVGLLLSLCLCRWGYKVKHIDNRPVPTKTGRADGIQPRSIEILRNLGLKRKIMAYEPAKVYNVAFWDPLPDGKGICRTGNWPSCPDFIDTRYPFTALLHQGKIERVFLEEIEKTGTVVERPSTVVGFKNDGKDPEYPVEVNLKDLDTNVHTTVRAKYLFGGEGARSFIREQQNIGIRHKDPIAHVWGVMDGVVRTNFPDIKVGLQSPFEIRSFSNRMSRPNAQFTLTMALLWLSLEKMTWSVYTSNWRHRPTRTGTQE